MSMPLPSVLLVLSCISSAQAVLFLDMRDTPPVMRFCVMCVVICFYVVSCTTLILLNCSYNIYLVSIYAYIYIYVFIPPKHLHLLFSSFYIILLLNN